MKFYCKNCKNELSERDDDIFHCKKYNCFGYDCGHTSTCLILHNNKIELAVFNIKINNVFYELNLNYMNKYYEHRDVICRIEFNVFNEKIFDNYTYTLDKYSFGFNQSIMPKLKIKDFNDFDPYKFVEKYIKLATFI